jgi:hypothetical protein
MFGDIKHVRPTARAIALVRYCPEDAEVASVRYW